jgi:hypothetical protein
MSNNNRKAAQAAPIEQEPSKEGSTTWDKAVATLATAYSAAGELARDAVYQGTQGFVTQALLGETYHQPEQAEAKEPEPAHDKDEGLDR